MKKSVLTIWSLLIITPPLIGGSIGLIRDKLIKDNISIFPGKYDSLIGQSYNPTIKDYISNLSISNVNNEDPEGIMSNVTYYGKRDGKKETLDIYLDSQTQNENDSCFLIVTILNSKGEKEYQSGTINVSFEGSTHYIMELEPPKIENEEYREFRVAATFYSNSTQRNQSINFIVEYPYKKNIMFNNNVNYESTYPIATKYYLNGEEEKIYENFKFMKVCNLEFSRPIFNIDDLYFKYDYLNKEIALPNYSECYLLIAEIYNNTDLDEENNMKKIPLKLKEENDQIKFELVNKYYYDSLDGLIYQNNKAGRNEINNLMIPSTFDNEEAVYYELHIKGLSSNENNFIFISYASFSFKWFGSCDDSYFCVVSKDNLLENINYSGGVTI